MTTAKDDFIFQDTTDEPIQFGVWLRWNEGREEYTQQFGYGDNRRTQWLVGQALASYPDRHLLIRKLDNGA